MEHLAALGALLGGVAAVLTVVSAYVAKKNERELAKQAQDTQSFKENNKENIDHMKLTLQAMQSHITTLTREKDIDRELMAGMQKQLFECTQDKYEMGQRLAVVEERLARYEQPK